MKPLRLGANQPGLLEQVMLQAKAGNREALSTLRELGKTLPAEYMKAHIPML